MARCPNCSYVLVSLGDSQRCKCAKCGRLFSRKASEDREFRTWNEKQRELDAETLAFEIKWKQEEMLKKRVERQKRLLEMQNRPKLTEEEKAQKIIQYNKMRYLKRKEQKALQRKLRRQHEQKQVKLQGRIEYWRKQQKNLALQTLENRQYTAI